MNQGKSKFPNSGALRKLKRCTIKEEFVALTGDAVSAAMLNQLIFWQEIINKQDQERLEEIEALEKIGESEKAEKLRTQLRDGWFWKSAQELSDEIMFSTRATVDRKLKDLVNKGILESKKNPDKKTTNRSNFYRVPLVHIQKELESLGYSLEGYTLSRPIQENASQSIAQNEQWEKTASLSIAQNEQSNAQNEQCITQNEQSISNITSIGFQSLNKKEEEEDYNRRLRANYIHPYFENYKNIINRLLATKNYFELNQSHQLFIKLLHENEINEIMALKLLDQLKDKWGIDDIGDFYLEAIEISFQKYQNEILNNRREKPISVFQSWMASTLFNTNHNVDQKDIQQWKQTQLKQIEEERQIHIARREAALGRRQAASTSEEQKNRGYY